MTVKRMGGRMLPLLLLLVSALLLMPVLRAHGAEPSLAGYIASFDLKGRDAEAPGTVVIRDGAELLPKLLMPLYVGDILFLREAESRLVVDLGEDGEITLGGELMRHEMTSALPTGPVPFRSCKIAASSNQCARVVST